MLISCWKNTNFLISLFLYDSIMIEKHQEKKSTYLKISVSTWLIQIVAKHGFIWKFTMDWNTMHCLKYLLFEAFVCTYLSNNCWSWIYLLRDGFSHNKIEYLKKKLYSHPDEKKKWIHWDVWKLNQLLWVIKKCNLYE